MSVLARSMTPTTAEVATIPEEAIKRLRSLEHLDESPFLQRGWLQRAPGDASSPSRRSSGSFGESDKRNGGSRVGAGGDGVRPEIPFSPVLDHTLPPWARPKVSPSARVTRNRGRPRDLPWMVTAPRALDPPRLVATHHRTPTSRGTSGSAGSFGGGGSSSASMTGKFTPKAAAAAAAMTMTVEAKGVTVVLGSGSKSTRSCTDDRDDNCRVGEPPRATVAISPSTGSSLSLRERQKRGTPEPMHNHTGRRSSIGSNRNNASAAPTRTREEPLRAPISAEKYDGEGRGARTTAIAPTPVFRREEAGGGGDGRKRMVSERAHIIDPYRKERLQQALALTNQTTSVKRAASRAGTSSVLAPALPGAFSESANDLLGSSSLGTLVFDDGGGVGGRGSDEGRGHSRGRDRGHGISRPRRDRKTPAALAEDQKSVPTSSDRTTPATVPQPLSPPLRLPMDKLEADLLTLRPFNVCGRPQSSVTARRRPLSEPGPASSSSLPLRPSSGKIPPSHGDPGEGFHILSPATEFLDHHSPFPTTTTNTAGSVRTIPNSSFEKRSSTQRSSHQVDPKRVVLVGWARVLPKGKGMRVMEAPSPFSCRDGTPVTQGRGGNVAADFSSGGVSELIRTADGHRSLFVETTEVATAAADGDGDIKGGGTKRNDEGAFSGSEGFLKQKRRFFSGGDDGWGLGLRARVRGAMIDTKSRDDKRREETLSTRNRIARLIDEASSRHGQEERRKREREQRRKRLELEKDLLCLVALGSRTEVFRRVLLDAQSKRRAARRAKLETFRAALRVQRIWRSILGKPPVETKMVVTQVFPLGGKRDIVYRSTEAFVVCRRARVVALLMLWAVGEAKVNFEMRSGKRTRKEDTTTNSPPRGGCSNSTATTSTTILLEPKAPKTTRWDDIDIPNNIMEMTAPLPLAMAQQHHKNINNTVPPSWLPRLVTRLEMRKKDTLQRLLLAQDKLSRHNLAKKRRDKRAPIRTTHQQQQQHPRKGSKKKNHRSLHRNGDRKLRNRNITASSRSHSNSSSSDSSDNSSTASTTNNNSKSTSTTATTGTLLRAKESPRGTTVMIAGRSNRKGPLDHNNNGNNANNANNNNSLGSAGGSIAASLRLTLKRRYHHENGGKGGGGARRSSSDGVHFSSTTSSSSLETDLSHQKKSGRTIPVREMSSEQLLFGSGWSSRLTELASNIDPSPLVPFPAKISAIEAFLRGERARRAEEFKRAEKQAHWSPQAGEATIQTVKILLGGSMENFKKQMAASRNGPLNMLQLYSGEPRRRFMVEVEKRARSYLEMAARKGIVKARRRSLQLL